MSETDKPPFWRRAYLYVKNNPRAYLYGIYFYWLLFIAFNLYTWEKTALFNQAWWRDTVSHTVFGLTLPMSILYVYSAFTLKGVTGLEKSEKRELVVAKTKWWTAGAALVWELIELAYDWYILPNFGQFLIEAQKGSADTTIDIAVTVAAAWCTTEIYDSYKRKAAKNRPYDHAVMAERIADWEKLTEELCDDIQNMRKEDRGLIVPPALKKITRFVQRKKSTPP